MLKCVIETPCWAAAELQACGILRLRECFASRTLSAQDDSAENLYERSWEIWGQTELIRFFSCPRALILAWFWLKWGQFDGWEQSTLNALVLSGGPLRFDLHASFAAVA